MLKQTQLRFKLGVTKDEITARSGLAVYAEFLRGFGVKELIERRMPLPGSNRGYKAWQYIEPLMLMLYGGGKHIEDLREVVEDKALRKLIGLKKIPSVSTVGDWLVRMGNGSGLKCLQEVIEKVAKKALRKHDVNGYTLWSDPTLIESEKREAKKTYEGFKGYRPILTALKELPVVVCHRFREGNAMGGVVEALEGAYRVLPAGKRIKHASLDSEFYTLEVINFLGGKRTTFAIAASKDSAVREAIKGINAWKVFKTEEGEETDREVGESLHTMNGTEEAFRLVVLRWKKKQPELFNSDKYHYHAIATSLDSPAEAVIWQYNDRGQMENVIKEIKLGMRMESLPSGDFGANAFWFALGVITYNMFILQKEMLLPEQYRRKTIQTLRWSLIGIAGKVIKHGRSLWLLLASTLDKYRIYRDMRIGCMVFT